MPAPADQHTNIQRDQALREDPEDRADLERLATELTARGYQADIRTPAGELPHLYVRNPRASILAERVYAQAGAFWWPWAERIADRDEVSKAAGILERVLRTVGE